MYTDEQIEKYPVSTHRVDRYRYLIRIGLNSCIDVFPMRQNEHADKGAINWPVIMCLFHLRQEGMWNETGTGWNEEL